jgi:two-component system, LytTR family, sensor kinase
VSTAPVDPNPRSRPYWLLIAAACLVPAGLDVFQSYMQARLAGQPARWQDLVFQGAEWLFLGALTPITYVLAKRFPFRRSHWLRTLAVHIGGALALCFGWASLGLLLGILLQRYPAHGPLPRAYVSWILTSIPWSVFLYFTMLGCVYAVTYFLEARQREAQQARLAAQLAEARLAALRMQLHPHFLFNSLNAIAVLVRDQKTRDASRMLELLGGLLRQVLQGEKRQEITLEEELRFVEQYLAIEQVRFSDRLQVQWSIDPEMRAALVPEFILQPLVENAVRHGVAKRSEAGTIEVAARRSEGDLVLSVRDDGPGYSPEDAEAGVGLANTRERLETLFGDAGRLELLRAESGGTLATVRLPLRQAGDEEASQNA